MSSPPLSNNKESKLPPNTTAPNFVLKTPKGTRDFDEVEMSIRNNMFSTIVSIFELHGGVTIDTPVFELRSILSDKYGEESKLIYDLKDQGGELLSLRYDLTVPFARFLAMKGTLNQSIKKYMIGKVYRRDQPSINKGRMREFYQCDFDIAGTHDPLIPDSEVIYIVSEILEKLNIPQYLIKINNRKILDGIFDTLEIPQTKFKSICSSIDKLDKQPWGEIKKELVQKEINIPTVDKIGEIINEKNKNITDLILKLKSSIYYNNSLFKEGLLEIEKIHEYLTAYNISNKIVFDISLARGLDYYTGIIFEAVLLDSKLEVGSIAAGGRYDNLVSTFMEKTNSSKKKKNKELENKKENILPCVGMSIGIERLFAILSTRQKTKDIKHKPTQVYIISIKEDLVAEKIKIARMLWENKISTEFSYKKTPKLKNQFDYCSKNKIPLALILGSSEMETNTIKLKEMDSQNKPEEKNEVTLSRDIVVEELLKRLKNLEMNK